MKNFFLAITLVIIAIVGVVVFDRIYNPSTGTNTVDNSSESLATRQLVPSRDDIVGQWRSVVENPAHKNTVSKRYMRHSFFDDGTLVVENEENSTKQKKWQFSDGVFVVRSVYGTSKFIEHYKMVEFDVLVKTKFKSIVDGEAFADYNPNDRFVRQGSTTEKAMKTLDIFKAVSGSMDFIDPNSLKVGSEYTLSEKTPVMPGPPPSDTARILSDISKITYANGGQSIVILGRKRFGNTLWYKVMVSGNEGWINSIALFGQRFE